jgi:hypothetical protein
VAAEASSHAHRLLIFRFAAFLSLWNTANAATFPPEKGAKENTIMDREPSVRPQRPYPAEKARSGEVVLKKPLQRWVFVAGLVGAILLVLILSLFR